MTASTYTSSPQETALRTSLAIVRGMKLMDDVTREASSTVEHHEAKRFDYLESLFYRIHREIYQDWGTQSPQMGAPGFITDSTKRLKVREAIRSFVENGNGEGHDSMRLFDGNGMVISHPPEKLAEILAKFYQTMHEIYPFDYGNNMTLDFLVTAIGQLPGFRAVYPNGIDLRRLESRDIENLHRIPPLDSDQVRLAFTHALDPARTPALTNKADATGFQKWPKNVEYVAGIPFLSHKMEKDGQEITCLVTVNGGLVPLETIQKDMEDHLIGDGLISNLPPISEDKLVGHLLIPDPKDKNNNIAPQMARKSEIDGFAIDDGAAPLLCLDVNIMTGLRPATHDQFKALLEQVAGRETPITRLNKNDELRQKLIDAVHGDERMQAIIKVAYDHINIMVDKLDAEKEAILKKVAPASGTPQLLLSMGGAGSGKTAAEDMAKKICNISHEDEQAGKKNFVVASLDQFRDHSDLYKVLKAANHHADDYTVIEPFANSLRDWVTAGALKERKNLLFDGTGIVYQPRYSGIVDRFKKEGYETQVVGVDTMLVAPPGRRREFNYPATDRIIDRYTKTERALPWLVVTGKHSKMPESVLQALSHPALDKISLFSNDGERGQHYLLAESFTLEHDKLADLQTAKQNGTLCDYLKTELIDNRDDSASKCLNGYTGEDQEGNARTYTQQDILERNKNFREDNVTFLAYPRGDKIQVMAVYDMQRFTDLIVKAQMNAQANSPKVLWQAPPASMQFRAA